MTCQKVPEIFVSGIRLLLNNCFFHEWSQNYRVRSIDPPFHCLREFSPYSPEKGLRADKIALAGGGLKTHSSYFGARIEPRNDGTSTPPRS